VALAYVMMGGFFEVIGIGISAFIATNIDDLFILMVFFAKCSFPPFQIILGQYVCMSLLLVVSLISSLVSLIIPHNLIGLIGFFPIAIGIKELLDLRKEDESDNADDDFIVTERLSN
jgi:cadmium resistance protein CadD (predicted permease)